MIDGRAFDSKKEARRYAELKLEQLSGLISGLRLQVSFKISVNGILICRYRADFSYVKNGSRIVEDVKGFKTPEYKLKARLMLAIYGIVILET